MGDCTYTGYGRRVTRMFTAEYQTRDGLQMCFCCSRETVSLARMLCSVSLTAEKEKQRAPVVA